MAVRPFNELALCSGIGGLSLALKLAEPAARCIAHVEGEAFAAAVLVRRMEEALLDQAVVWSDVRTFDGRPWRGVVDIVTAGYPCQPFSLAGRRQGEDDPRHLWPSIKRIVEEVEPEWFFAENVPGHVSMGLEAVLDDIQGMGYRVAAGLFTAAEVGASHKRERLFVLAHAQRDGLQGALSAAESSSGVRRRPSLASGALADPVGQGSPGWPLQSGDGGAECEAAERVRGDALEHPDFAGLQGAAWIALQGAWGADGVADRRRGDIPLFPPGPGDLDGWRRVLEARPDLEPAVRRLASGPSTRMDELRAIGNSVCPIQGAFAFLELARALE